MKWKKREKAQNPPTVAEAITHHLPTTGRTMLSHFPSKRLLTSLKPPLFPFIAEHDVIWQGISLWMAEVISLSILLCIPQSSLWSRAH